MGGGGGDEAHHGAGPRRGRPPLPPLQLVCPNQHQARRLRAGGGRGWGGGIVVRLPSGECARGGGVVGGVEKDGDCGPDPHSGGGHPGVVAGEGGRAAFLHGVGCVRGWVGVSFFGWGGGGCCGGGGVSGPMQRKGRGQTTHSPTNFSHTHYTCLKIYIYSPTNPPPPYIHTKTPQARPWPTSYPSSAG